MPQGGLASAAAPFGARYEKHFYIRKYYNAGQSFRPPCLSSPNAGLWACPRKQEVIGSELFPEDMTEWINKAAHKVHLSEPTQVIAFIRRSREEVCVCVCVYWIMSTVFSWSK